MQRLFPLTSSDFSLIRIFTYSEFHLQFVSDSHLQRHNNTAVIGVYGGHSRGIGDYHTSKFRLCT